MYLYSIIATWNCFWQETPGKIWFHTCPFRDVWAKSQNPNSETRSGTVEATLKTLGTSHEQLAPRTRLHQTCRSPGTAILSLWLPALACVQNWEPWIIDRFSDVSHTNVLVNCESGIFNIPQVHWFAPWGGYFKPGWILCIVSISHRHPHHPHPHPHHHHNISSQGSSSPSPSYITITIIYHHYHHVSYHYQKSLWRILLCLRPWSCLVLIKEDEVPSLFPVLNEVITVYR